MLPVFIMAIENDDDRTFVAELYTRCQPAMQRRALSILKNESDAEEAVHEAILRVIRHLEKVRMIPRDEVLYYLVTVTETASIDLYRKRQRESRATIGNENGWAEHLTDDNTAEQTMLRLEQRELLERCLAHLPQREIDLLNYYYILELPYPRLPIERINKVPNLAWLCIPCHRMVHNSPIPPELDAKAVRKIKKYREKLKK